MNRKKKINEALKKRQKKTNAKLHRSNKPRYISKADRAKMEAEAQQAEQSEQVQDVNPTESAEGEQPAE